MSFWLNEYQAWIKIIGLSLNLWNEEELHRVAVRMGTINFTMPYGLNAGQFEHITLYMNTGHLRNIPKFLRVWCGDLTKRVSVLLLGWRIEQEGYFSPPAPTN